LRAVNLCARWRKLARSSGRTHPTNDRRPAKALRSRSLKAVAPLARILPAARDRCASQEFERIRKAVGLAIGQVQTEIMAPIASRFPELDDLR
jgi:hypothetical protein